MVLRDEVPPADGHRYTVPLNNDLRFQAEEGRPNFELPGSPLPTWADVPFLTAQCHYDETWMEANFLLDTGAGAPILSEKMAMQLGLDSNGDGVLGRGPAGEDDGYAGDAEVGGLGGSVVVPIMSLSSLALPTEEGVDLRWTDPDWGIQVVIVSGLPEEIDGAMSIDLLTSGIKADYENWGDLSDPLPPLGEPYFRKIHLDFRDPDTGHYGTMYLDVSPLHHEIIPEPSTVLMLIVAAAGTFISRKRRHI